MISSSSFCFYAVLAMTGSMLFGVILMIFAHKIPDGKPSPIKQYDDQNFI